MNQDQLLRAKNLADLEKYAGVIGDYIDQVKDSSDTAVNDAVAVLRVCHEDLQDILLSEVLK